SSVDVSSLTYAQLRAKAKELGIPAKGKIGELREAVRQAQTDASNRQQTDISAGQSDPSSQPSASRTGEGQGAASINEQLESYLASIRKEHREKSLKVGFNRERGYFVSAPESFSAPESWSRYYARG